MLANLGCFKVLTDFGQNWCFSLFLYFSKKETGTQDEKMHPSVGGAARPPDAVAAEASAEVRRLEAAISVGREQPTCHSVEGGIEGCTRQIQGGASGSMRASSSLREPRSVSVAPTPSLSEPTKKVFDRDGSAGGRSETQRIGGGGCSVRPRASHST